MSKLRNLSVLGRLSRVVSSPRPLCSSSGGEDAGPSHKFTPQNFHPSTNFALDEAWAARIDALASHGLVGSYEWISILQKKFSSSGKASAVDMDITAQLAQEEDQRADLVDLLYRLRHTNNASDMLPSTEYAIYRLLVRYEDWENVFRLLNDTINYGAFMNEHVSCLSLYRLLQLGNIQGAVKISTCTIQQEMFDFALLNYLAIYSLSRWVELPAPERTIDEDIQPPAPSIDPDQYGDDEMKTMKFPFLKNDYFDNHFDLCTANALVRKSLLWFSWNLPKELPENGRNELKSRIDALLASEDPDTVPFIIEYGSSATPISSLTEQLFSPILEEAESKLLNHQQNLFDEWNERRFTLIKTQAERLNLTLRKEEIRRRRAEIIDEKKVLFFFENRTKWEEEAHEKDKLFEELQLNVKESQDTEKEYAESLFESARRISQGLFSAPVTAAGADSKKDMRKGKYIPKIVQNPPRREVPPLIERRDRQLAQNKELAAKK